MGRRRERMKVANPFLAILFSAASIAAKPAASTAPVRTVNPRATAAARQFLANAVATDLSVALPARGDLVVILEP
jgi:hypothetical protein